MRRSAQKYCKHTYQKGDNFLPQVEFYIFIEKEQINNFVIKDFLAQDKGDIYKNKP